MNAVGSRVPIGKSELRVAPLSLGCNVFGWTADESTSFEVLDAFVAGGGNFVDTADGYSHWVPGNSGGESEEILGAWLTSRRNREDVVVATKVSTHPQFEGLSPANVQAACDASLQRLRTDHIDLYYAHFDDPETPLVDTVRAFSDLVDAGKVRAIGVSNYSAARIDEWMQIARSSGFHLPVAVQPHYNLMERDFETNGLQDTAVRESLSVFPYFSLASGFLAGKYRDTARSNESPRAGSASAYLDDKGRAVLRVLDRVAHAHKVEVASVSLAWLRQQDAVTAPISSARNLEQLPALMASMSLELSAAERAELDEAAAA